MPRDLVEPFAVSTRFARGDTLPEGADRLRAAWLQHTGVPARRDFTSIDESGDFDGVAGDAHPLLVGAAVSFDAGTYQRMASLFYGWRHHVFGDEEVKSAGKPLSAEREQDFLDEVAATAASGYCAVTLGFIDKVSHHGGALLTDTFDKVTMRRGLHMNLLRRHTDIYRPRTRATNLYIDRCGLTGPQVTEYAKCVRRLFEELGVDVASDVQFVDSLLVEMVQLADLLAGVVRRRFDDPGLADPKAFDDEAAGLGRRFLLADLTVRT